MDNENSPPTIPTSNRYSPLDPDHRPSPKPSDQRPPSPTPLDTLSKKIIPVPCDDLLIGDSIVCNVRQKLSPHGALIENFSVPGLSVQHLHRWLSSQTPSKSIRRVTVHVGINSCLESGPIDSVTWQRVIKQLRRVFPGAKLQASSILPPFGRHPVSTAVNRSNVNLCHVCAGEGVVFIDHTASFHTASGAPRKTLYKYMDRFHPSEAGVAVMLNKLYQTSKPLLPTPASVSPGNFSQLDNSRSARPYPMNNRPIDTRSKPVGNRWVDARPYPSNNRHIDAGRKQASTQLTRSHSSANYRSPGTSSLHSVNDNQNGQRNITQSDRLSDKDYPPLPPPRQNTAWGRTVVDKSGSSHTPDTRKLLQTLLDTIQQALI